MILRVSLVQTPVQWENPEGNRIMFSEKLADLAGKTDLVVLPEMFTTGFTMRAEAMAEPMDGSTIQWMKQQANLLQAALTGSFICFEDGHYFNRLVFVKPDGSIESYDKKHLFTLAGENETFKPGQKRVVAEWKGWRICPLICYDLRFPVWSRNIRGSFFTGLNPYYDLLIYVANWPDKRIQHWRALLTARAIENQSFVLGVNIVGKDGNGLEYTGHSMAVDFGGQAFAHLDDGKEDIITLELNKSELNSYRRQLPFLQDGDVFEFKA
jgi:predicted amidohydrolase